MNCTTSSSHKRPGACTSRGLTGVICEIDSMMAERQQCSRLLASRLALQYAPPIVRSPCLPKDSQTGGIVKARLQRHDQLQKARAACSPASSTLNHEELCVISASQLSSNTIGREQLSYGVAAETNIVVKNCKTGLAALAMPAWHHVTSATLADAARHAWTKLQKI